MPSIFESHGISSTNAGFLLGLERDHGGPRRRCSIPWSGGAHARAGRDGVLADGGRDSVGYVGLLLAPAAAPALWAVADRPRPGRLLPARADDDRPAQRLAADDPGGLDARPVDRLPARRGRADHDRRAARRDRLVDAAADRAADRRAARAPGAHRPGARAPRARSRCDPARSSSSVRPASSAFGHVAERVAQLAERPRAPDDQRGDRHAAAAVERRRSRARRVAVDRDAVGERRVAEVLDARPVLVAPEARQRRRRGRLAGDRVRDRRALAPGRLPVAAQRVAAEVGVVEGRGVAGGVDVGQRGAPAGVGRDAVGREPRAGEPAAGRGARRSRRST